MRRENCAWKEKIDGAHGAITAKTLRMQRGEFVPVQNHPASELLPAEKPFEPIDPAVADTETLLDKKHPVTLKNFGRHATLSEVEIDHAGERYQLPVYKRPSWVNFLGISGNRYDLVVPEEAAAKLSPVFGKRKAVPVYFPKVKGKVSVKKHPETNTGLASLLFSRLLHS